MTAKRKAYIVLSWLAVVLCMGLIFWFSASPAEESSGMSNSVIKRIMDLLGVELSSFIVRKAAHMTEFAGLAMLSFNAVYATWKIKLTPVAAFAMTVLYAVTDEVHQLFVEGRACQLRDVFIDSAGALLGVAAALIILKLLKILWKRGNKNGSVKAVSGSASEK